MEYVLEEKNGQAKYNMLGALRPIVIAMMESEGRDFNRCELCGNFIPDNEFEIHHDKYEGATYYDLRIVCMGCNRGSDYWFLD
jgi:Pyruvate/2-oxoacid:ferredoxin oxidoreductase delta subunit